MSKVRIECRLPNASHLINNVGFGVVDAPKDGPRLLLSEPIDDPVAEAFCRGQGFTRAETYDPAILQRVDAEIAQARASAKAGTSGGALDAANRTITELQQANLAISAERNAAITEAATLRTELKASAIPTLKAQVDQLAQEKAELQHALTAAQREVESLRSVNAQLTAPTGATEGAEQANDPKAKGKAAAK